MHAVIGNGALGAATALALEELGEEVRIVQRAGTHRSSPVSSRDREVVTADFYDRGSLTRAVRGADVVHQVAQPPYPQWAKQFPALQDAVIDACAVADASLVLADNLYGYGPPAGILTEDSPRDPTARKGIVRKAMAEVALRAHRDGRLQVALVRPSNFFGPTYERGGKDVFVPAAEGKPMMFLGRIDQPHSFSYLPDAGRAMATIGTSGRGWGEAWIAPVQQPITQFDFACTVWAAAGHSGEPKISRLTKNGARLLGIFSPLVRELPEMMYEYDRPFVVDSTKFQTAFDVVPTGFDAAVEETLSAWR